jgi:pSer/pThr/pTyr-binding forkhead associated (FHA) protein
MMLLADEFKQRQETSNVSMSVSMRQMSMRGISQRSVSVSQRGGIPGTPTMGGGGLPQLQLFNDSLGIRIVGINGAVIGRKQAPYMHFFKTQAYVSGAHAQLLFRPESGWCIADRGSSNGTKLNDHRLQPDVEMSIKNGDIVTIANVVLKVVISVN